MSILAGQRCQRLKGEGQASPAPAPAHCQRQVRAECACTVQQCFLLLHHGCQWCLPNRTEVGSPPTAFITCRCLSPLQTGTGSFKLCLLFVLREIRCFFLHKSISFYCVVLALHTVYFVPQNSSFFYFTAICYFRFFSLFLSYISQAGSYKFQLQF